MKSPKADCTISDTLAQIIESLRSETYGRERVYFGLGDYQGGRLVIQIPVYFSEIPSLVPVVNRPINSTHIKEIKNYIIRRTQSSRAWILGSLTANVSPNDIHVTLVGSKLYIVRIPNVTLLHITDGQHRIQAITELMASDEHRSSIADEQIPLTLVLDNNANQAALDFRDMAQTLKLSPSLYVQFSSEGKDAIACALVEKVDLFRNNTEMMRASPGSGTKNIYTAHYIAQLVGCAISGNADAELLEYDTPDKIEFVSTVLSKSLNQFFSHCLCTKALVAQEQATPTDVAQFKSSSILALSLGLEILGHLIHRSNFAPKDLATHVDWSKNSDWWSDSITQGDGCTEKIKVKAAGAEEASQVADLTITRLNSLDLSLSSSLYYVAVVHNISVPKDVFASARTLSGRLFYSNTTSIESRSFSIFSFSTPEAAGSFSRIVSGKGIVVSNPVTSPHQINISNFF